MGKTLAPTPVAGLLIDNRWEMGAAPPVLLTEPYSGAPLPPVPQAGPEQMEQAVAAARLAFAAWRRTPAYRRAQLLQAGARALAGARAELAALMAAEIGKPVTAAGAEVDRAVAILDLSAEEARRLAGEVVPLDAMAGGEGRTGLVLREPLGPVACITPYNYPVHLLAHKVGPALAAGNTVVIKPSPAAVLTTRRVAELLAGAGLPPGAVNLVPAGPAVTAALAAHPDVPVVSFTGSSAVGEAIRREAGLKRVVLELGSNAGAVVCADADLDLAAARCAWGGFVYAGQSCISVQRIYVHDAVRAPFTARLLAAVARLRVGNPALPSTDVGPLISADAAARVAAWVAEAVAGGARVLWGGERTGALMAPTVLDGVSPDMQVMCREVFGPVVSLQGFGHLDQAVAAINDSPYGLHAGIFTRDLANVLQAMREMAVAGVVVNDAPTLRLDHMPYGGRRLSGLGREGIRYALEDMTALKAVYLPA